MTTRARLAQGTKFQRETAPGTGLYVTIAELNNIGGPNLTSEDLEVTSHDSPGGWKEFMSGLKDGGAVTIDGHFVPEEATHQTLHSDVGGLVRNYRMLLPTAVADENKARWTFAAKVNSVNFTNPAGNNTMGFNASLKISGEPEITLIGSGGLTALAISEGVLTPAFDNAVYEYSASVANATDSLTVTPTAASHDITVNGETVLTTEASDPIALSVGLNRIYIVAKEDDKHAMAYTVYVYRAGA